ncbi:MAG TPA: methionine--tRNA ligase [Bacteroidota bacterium]|nr:methionine--tRNA ligase [Bacteroidota bacterium]
MQNEKRKILITAALPYANGKIHLGHLAGAYLPADIYARYHRSMKHQVMFICGSDEHGVPITITAEQEKTTPQAIVDRYHALNKAAFEQFGMSFDNYSRTSLPLHHETAKEFFLLFHRAGILREKKEKQFYDEAAKMFLPDRYVEGTCPVCRNPEARGDQCEKCGTYLNPVELIDPKSKITGGRPVLRDTTHWYFPLGAYQARLEEYIRKADADEGWKENVLNYCRGWFKEGLQDRAVTRDLPWGVRVPLAGFEDKVLYVWFDAVLGYISATKELSLARGKENLWKEYWCDPATHYTAFIGKDNIVFHCIVFPAMLMAWNEFSPGDRFILPANVPANEFLNFEGQKFSKSRGWGIDVDEFLAEFPADTLRYSLVMNLPESRDADFTWKDFQARTNNELADILGNFVNRTLTFVQRNFDGKVPDAAPGVEGREKELFGAVADAVKTTGELIGRYRFRDATAAAMNLARSANQYFDRREPWKMLRTSREGCGETMYVCLHLIRSLAILLEPVLPNTTAGMWKMLNLPGSPAAAGWRSAAELAIPPGHRLGTPAILFAKFDDAVIGRHLGKLAGPAPESPVPPPAAKPEFISIDQFKSVELRVAKIVEAERVPKSEKLVRLRVSLGSQERQIVAGIAQHYTPEQLVGRKIVVVANLAPARLMGQESQGMLLAASTPDGQLAFITPEKDIPEGSIVK